MVDYEEGFEPFVIAPRRLVPWYDPRFRGYGRNKVSHLLHCAALGMRFAVLPEDWVVHRPHSPSCAFNATLGPAELRDPHRFPRIMQLYASFKENVLKSPAQASLSFGQGVAPRAGGCAEPMGRWMARESPDGLRGRHAAAPGAFTAYLLNQYRHKFDYRPAELRRVACLRTDGVAPKGCARLTLCTTLTPDRIGCLLRQGRHWDGPMSAAVLMPTGSGMAAALLRWRLRAVLAELGREDTRRVTIQLFAERRRRLGVAPWRAGELRAPLVPINSLRNAAMVVRVIELREQFPSSGVNHD
mmetsp:Transcript_27613/g.71005  ORF Transcript_27613/g.71005 Transcript_27613/m.71005 type:complete len:300 (+) Transcript_27613:906-1805(+)